MWDTVQVRDKRPTHRQNAHNFCANACWKNACQDTLMCAFAHVWCACFLLLFTLIIVLSVVFFWTTKNKTKLQAAFCYMLTRGAFHWTKTFEIFDTVTNATEISWERFQKIFSKTNNSPINYGNSTMKINWKGNFKKNVFKKFGLLQEVVLFPQNYRNSQFST